MASSSRHIIFLNRFFYPDHAATSELLSDLAFELARRGLQIKVITSRLGYDNTANALPSHETINGVEVFRVWTSRQGRHRLHRRILDYVSFYVAAAWQLWRVARAGDVIVAKTDPPFLSVISAAIAWLRGARLVNWQQDIFPEVAEALGIGGAAGRLGFALLRRPRNWSLRRADLTVVVNDPMSSTLNRLGVAQEKIRTIPNWADGKAIVPIDASKNALRTDWGLDNHFVVGYAGNLGRAHEIDTVLSTMRALDQSPIDAAAQEGAAPVKFLFIGGGALRPSLEEQARKWRLGNVQFRDYQPRKQLAATLGVADVHLVILNPALEGLCMPSKLYAIAAVGRPAIFIGDPEGEVAQILRDVGCGFAVAPSNVIELKQRILELARSPELRRIMGTRARVAFEQRWDREIAVASWQRILEELIGSESQVSARRRGDHSDQSSERGRRRRYRPTALLPRRYLSEIIGTADLSGCITYRRMIVRKSLVGLIALALLAYPATAPAHAQLDRAVPAVGSTVSSSPGQITLYFTEQLEPKFSGAEVHGAAGARVDHGANISGKVMRLSVGTLAPGNLR